MRSAVAFIVGLCVIGSVSSAFGATVYQNTAGSSFAEWFSPKVLDDVTVSGSGPVIIQKIDFGVENWHSTQAWSIDAVVTFWDTVDSAAGSYAPVVSGNLGSFRHSFGSVAAGSVITTGLISLPSDVTVTDGSFGVEISIYAAGTSNYVGDNNNGSVYPIINANQVPTIGTTNVAYWSDIDWDGGFTGFDRVAPNTTGGNDRNGLYLQIDAVPEPASLALLGGLSGVLLLSRRRGRMA